MKNLIILNITSFLLLVMLFTSCNEFLEETPKSQEPTEAFFQTENQVQGAVDALYSKENGPASMFIQRGFYFDASYAHTLDNLSGMSDNPAQQNPSLQYFSNLTQSPEFVGNFVGGIWSGLYASISNCNTVIARVEKSSNINASVKKQGLATARFFRAFNYYFLVRLFGKVPIVTQPVVSATEDFYPARGSVEKVYELITSDLEWALANGNLADVPMGSNGNKISKGSVACVLSEVYLTMAGSPLKKGAPYYTKALNMAETVIKNGAYKLFDHSGGTTAFDKLRLIDFDKGSEYLYFIEYFASIQSSSFPLWSFPSSFPSPIPHTTVERKYSRITLNWQPKKNLLKLYDSSGNDIRRRNRQFFHNKFPYKGSDGVQRTIDFKFVSPFRWYDSIALFVNGNSGKYTCVYRLADVLLIAAEAANELTGDPTPYLSPILNRAYVTPPAVPTNQTERRNLILAERYRELAMEAHTWFDMLRTQLYPDVDADGRVTFSPLLQHDNGRGQRYSKKDMLLPLPPTEMQRNPNLKPQNEEY